MSTGPAAGVGLEDFPSRRPAASSTVRFGTLNIASGRGPDGNRDLDRVARSLASVKLDFVALQEVRGQCPRREDNQAARLGRSLECGWLFAPAETQWYCRQFGNGVLSRLPVRQWQRIPLPRVRARSCRNAVSLEVDIGLGRRLSVLATHLTQRNPRDRQAQLKVVVRRFLALDEPAMLLGDLNTPPDAPAIRELLAHPGVDDPIGRLVPEAPKGRVDWILLRGLRAVAAGMSDKPVSDHPLYWVEIECRGNRPDNEVK